MDMDIDIDAGTNPLTQIMLDLRTITKKTSMCSNRWILKQVTKMTLGMITDIKINNKCIKNNKINMKMIKMTMWEIVQK